MLITSKPKKVIGILSSMMLLLLAAHLVFGIYSQFYLQATAYGLVELFDMNQEHNLPTLFSSLMMLAAAALLFIIASARRKEKKAEHWYWHGLALVFSFLSVDEITRLHERFNEPVRNAFSLGSTFHFAWIIPYGLFVMVLVGLYTRFIFRTVPKKTRLLMILAAIIFISGALGLELLGSYYFSKAQQIDLTFALLATVEELMEMTGLLIFIYALMEYLATELKGLYFHVGQVPEAQTKPAATAPAEQHFQDPVGLSAENGG